MNRVVHFEIPADDPARAKAFYSTAFAWEIQSIPEMGYHFVFTTPIDETSRMPKEPGAINGGMMQRNELVDRIVITLQVDDMEAATRRVTEAGGTVLGEPQQVGDVGIAGYFHDTEGNLVGLWQSLT